MGLLCVCAVAVVVLLGVQRRSLKGLRVQAADERASAERRLATLSEEASRQSEDVADKAELERLRGDREALERLRGEVVALKKSVAETRLLPARKLKPKEGEVPDIAKKSCRRRRGEMLDTRRPRRRSRRRFGRRRAVTRTY